MPSKNLSPVRKPLSRQPATLKIAPSQATYDRINHEVASDPSLPYRSFDYEAYMRCRSYALDNITFNDTETVALLDTGVLNLLPSVFNRLPALPAGDIEIKYTGDKGMGMFARDEIPAGCHVLTEHPIIVSPYLVGFSVEMYEQLLDRLSPSACRQLMSLANNNTSKGCHALEGILQTSGLPIELNVPYASHPEITTHRAIFPQTSRCNHSCGPNATWEWDASTFSLCLKTVRPIYAGEEITIPYIPLDQSRDERQERLQSMHGFTCICEYCNLPSYEAVKHSDQARQTLSICWSQLPSFEEWCLDTSMADDALINVHKQAIYLIEREGLHIMEYGKHIDALGMCYGALEDTPMFKFWVERALDLRNEANPEKAVVFKKWLAVPKSFPVWGWRKTFCGVRGGKKA